MHKAASALDNGSHGTWCIMNFDHSIEPWEGVNVSLQVCGKENIFHSGQLLGMLFNPSSNFHFKG